MQCLLVTVMRDQIMRARAYVRIDDVRMYVCVRTDKSMELVNVMSTRGMWVSNEISNF